MSSEQININQSIVPKIAKDNIRCRVDINTLMQNIKKEKDKKNKENLFLYSLIFLVVIVLGLLISL